MQTQALSAPQSRNLTLKQTLFKSAFKSQARRQWLRGNLALRTWSRNTTAKYGNILLWVMSCALFGGFVSVAFENDTLTAIFALIAMLALLPELTSLSNEHHNDKKGGCE